MNCDNCPTPITEDITLSSKCSGATFLLFVKILEYFIPKQCDIEDPCGRISPRDHPNKSYDFIVIGSGSGGAVVASRLSEEKSFSVLLLEAGLDEIGWVRVPNLSTKVVGTQMDWQHISEVEKNACLNRKERRCTHCAGKVLGGTSSLNGMMYMRGSHKDFNDWEKLGNKGWSFRDVLPFFKKSEDNMQIDEVDPEYHGTGGPLPISQFNDQPAMTDDILDAARELGYNILDLNGRSHTGWAIAQTTTSKGTRYSTARAFLRPARNRQNLHIMLNSTATKIIFNVGKKAIAVEFYKNGKFVRVGVNKEVIVSAGAVNSPQILLNSGIGPRKELKVVKVPVVHDLPGVGKNFHDHVSYVVPMTIKEKGGSVLNWMLIMEYLLTRKGPLSSTGGWQVTGMINTKYAIPEDDHPDVHIVYGGYGAECSEIAEEKNKNSRRVVTTMPVVLHPKSRGYVCLRNNDPLSRPHISANYFSHPYDIAVLVDAIKFVITMTQQEALKKYDFQLIKKPVKNCEHLEFASDAYWKCAIRHDTALGGHMAGSCKMGPKSDPMAVVDNQLRVKGIQGVRVADASIMPRVTSGNTNAPSIMIGERAADFIKKSWLSKN